MGLASGELRGLAWPGEKRVECDGLLCGAQVVRVAAFVPAPVTGTSADGMDVEQVFIPFPIPFPSCLPSVRLNRAEHWTAFHVAEHLYQWAHASTPPPGSACATWNAVQCFALFKRIEGSSAYLIKNYLSLKKPHLYVLHPFAASLAGVSVPRPLYSYQYQYVFHLSLKADPGNRHPTTSPPTPHPPPPGTTRSCVRALVKSLAHGLALI